MTLVAIHTQKKKDAGLKRPIQMLLNKRKNDGANRRAEARPLQMRPNAERRTLKRTLQLVFKGGAFTREENFCWRLDGEFLGVIALIDGDADAATRILIEQRIADGNVHECFAEGEHKRFAIELKADFVADGVTERAKIVALNVGYEGAERIVKADDVAGDAFFFDGGGFWAELDEVSDLRAGNGVVPSGGKMRASGRKNVAAVECGRDGGREHPGGVGDFVGGLEAVAVDDRRDEAVVGENEVLTFFRFDDDGFARGADAGIDNDDEDGSSGVVRRNGGEEARTFLDLKRRDLMSDVHDAGVGQDLQHDGFAERDGVIGGAEVGHENDGGVLRRGRRGIVTLPGARRA